MHSPGRCQFAAEPNGCVRSKIRQLVDECKSLRETLDRYLRTKNARNQDESERRRLLAGASPGSTSGVQNLLREATSLDNSNRMLSELEALGTSIIDSLVTQNATLQVGCCQCAPL